MRELVSDVGTMICLKAEQKGLVYKQTIESEIPDQLIGDELRVRQIMINLLNNAVKYTDSGKVELEISGKEQNDSSLSLCICVKDTGIGIRSEDLPNIFGDFQRLDEERNNQIEGTGLGLSIVKRMIGLMNGNISVESKYGEGSVFTALIPQEINKSSVANVSTEEKNKKPGAAITYHTPECVYLVVDDNKMNLIVAKRFLDKIKGHVETARGGDEALQKMRETKYDMIFMDHMMPDPDGIRTYELSRTDPENINLDTPMIMMTANALSGMREEYLKIGFADYISKPVEIAELLRVVRLLLPADRIDEIIEPND